LVPPAGGVAGHYEPDEDYWATVTVNLTKAGVVTTNNEYDDPRKYDDRSTYLADFSSSGYNEWEAQVLRPSPDVDVNWYFKETGEDIDSNDLANTYVETNGAYQMTILCRGSETSPYAYKEPTGVGIYGFHDTFDYWKAAWRPDPATYIYQNDSQKLIMKVYAVIGDACNTCYYKGLTYSFSLKYKKGSCTMKSDNMSTMSHLEFNYDSDETIDFTAQLSPTSKDNNKILINTISWEELAPSECRYITDFVLNSIN
jgi:hypothetical protein